VKKGAFGWNHRDLSALTLEEPFADTNPETFAASSTGFRCFVGHCYERDEPHPYLPFAEIIESNLTQAASLDDYRQQMGPYASGTGPDRTKPSALFSRCPSHWSCRLLNSAPIFSKA